MKGVLCIIPPDEVHVAAQPVQLCHDDRRLAPLGHLQRCGKLRPALQRVCSLARLHFLEGLDQIVALCLGEPSERGLLRLQSKARLALLGGAHADIGDGGFHGIGPPFET
jgi:hypothetical protein